MPIGLGRDALLRADFPRRAYVHRVGRAFTVCICVMALAGCGCITRSSMILQTAHSRKVFQSKKFTESKPKTMIPVQATPLISTTANSKKGTKSNEFTESKSRTPIPLPAVPLLSPQPEPSCEFETTASNADERQKLDYERQCYRHAEMIVRSRLQLLQGSADNTISAIKRTPIPLPAAPLLSPQPEPSCEITDTNADVRQKLDYERQCYRHAEMIVRDRLHLLQRSIDATISAVKRSERGGP
jgi:hypothetical protein